MQERRRTVRRRFFSRAQYCPSEDFAPYDARLVNVSERGLGLLLREPRPLGEQLTVSFFLPDEDDPFTATGVVRWIGRDMPKGWRSTGIEWLPLEETTRFRLGGFLDRCTSDIEPEPGSWLRISPSGWRALLLAALALGSVAAAWGIVWVRDLQHQNQQLDAALGQGHQVIVALHGRERALNQELDAARTHLRDSSGELARMDEQTQQLGFEVNRLQSDVAGLEQSYGKVEGERDQLAVKAETLEEENERMAKRLASLTELRIAVREAIERRRESQFASMQARVQAQEAQDRQALAAGNQGYLVRNGSLAGAKTDGWIRVLDPAFAPESPPTPPAAETAPATP